MRISWLTTICVVQLAALVSAPAAPETAAEAYYRAHPDFFRIRTLEDLPKDLKWQDGAEELEFASPKAENGGSLTRAIDHFPSTFRRVGPGANGAFRKHLYDDNQVSLVSRHPVTRNPIPGVAKAWAIGPGHRTVYYRLDSRARFSDGHAVSVDDFFSSFYFHRSPHLRAPWYTAYYRDKFQGITKFGDAVIAIKLSKASVDPVDETNLAPVPGHFYGEVGPDFEQTYNRQFEPTTGAYRLDLEKLIDKGSITLARNEEWWAKDLKFYRHRYNTDELVFVILPGQINAQKAILDGRIDALSRHFVEKDTPAPKVVAGKLTINRQYKNDVPRVNYGFYLNKKNALLADHDVRLGIAYAINMDGAIAGHMREGTERLRTLADGYGDYTPPKLKARSFSEKDARAAFARAGFTRQGADGILANKAGERLSFTVTANDGRYDDPLKFIQAEAAKLGLKLDLDLRAPTDAWEKVISQKHEIAFFGYAQHGVWPFLDQYLHSTNARANTNNITATADRDLDTVLDAYVNTSNRRRKVKYSNDILRWVHDDACFIPGFVMRFFETSYWHRVQFPEGFGVPASTDAFELGLFWIEERINRK